MTEQLLQMLTYEQTYLMPPSPVVCDACGSRHEPHEPHNAVSAQFQRWLAETKSRIGMQPGPAWREAAAHCDEATRRQWESMLEEWGFGKFDLSPVAVSTN